eukprot:gb/GECG01005978.1/.p1 GENE.gb/GECG01005978.1/~~gb/GECG01005978.1/.p1  ORF type:complete len:1334 (+),score=160.89 gb/GECG01005978.1/:1-4002(+)
MRGIRAAAERTTPCEPLTSFDESPHVLGVTTTAATADVALFLAYTMISAFLLRMRYKHKNVVEDVSRILLLFQLFIAACGLSHLGMMVNMVAATVGASWFSMLMKVAAALISLYTAVVLPGATHEVASKLYAKIENQISREERLKIEKAQALKARKIADEINAGTSASEVVQSVVSSTVKHVEGIRAVGISVPTNCDPQDGAVHLFETPEVNSGRAVFFRSRALAEAPPSQSDSTSTLSSSLKIGMVAALRLHQCSDKIANEIRQVMAAGVGQVVSPETAAFLLGPNADAQLLAKIAHSIRQSELIDQQSSGSNSSVSPMVEWSKWYACRIRVPTDSFCENANSESPLNVRKEYMLDETDQLFPRRNFNSNGLENSTVSIAVSQPPSTADPTTDSPKCSWSYMYAVMLVCIQEDSSIGEAEVGTFEDITNQCSRTMEQIRLVENEHERLRSLAKIEKQKRQANDTFLSMISYELRTPLHTILGYSDLLLGTSTTDEQREFLHTIVNSGSTLCELLNDILDLTKFELGEINAVAAPFSVRANIETALRLFSPRAQDKSTSINYISQCYRLDWRGRIAYDDIKGSWSEWKNFEPPEFVVGDEVRLRQILIKLLSNAVKFTEGGSILISATTVRVNGEHAKRNPLLMDPAEYLSSAVESLPFCWKERRYEHSVVYQSCSSNDGTQSSTGEPREEDGVSTSPRNVMVEGNHDTVVLIVEVADTGSGIDTNCGESIFEMFQRGASRTRGTGLGLAMVRNLVKMLGGEMVVTSKKGLGSSFFLCFSMQAANLSCSHCNELNEDSKGVSDNDIEPMSPQSGAFPEGVSAIVFQSSLSDYRATVQRLLESGASVCTSEEEFAGLGGNIFPLHPSSWEETLSDRITHDIELYDTYQCSTTLSIGRLTRLVCGGSGNDSGFFGTGSKSRLLVLDYRCLRTEQDVTYLNTLIAESVPMLLLAPSRRILVETGVSIPGVELPGILPREVRDAAQHVQQDSEEMDLTSLSQVADDDTDSDDDGPQLVDEVISADRRRATQFQPLANKNSRNAENIMVYTGTQPLALAQVAEVVATVISCSRSVRYSAYPLWSFLGSYFDTANACSVVNNGGTVARPASYFLDQENSAHSKKACPIATSVKRDRNASLSPKVAEGMQVVPQEGVYLKTGAFFPQSTRESTTEGTLRVIIVDEDPSNSEYVSRLLERIGVDSEVASDGKTATEKIKDATPKFDVMLLDLDMTTNYGFSILENVMKDGVVPQVRKPVCIATTASVLQADRERCTDAGVSYFIPKPFRSGDISQALEYYRKLEGYARRYYYENLHTVDEMDYYASSSDQWIGLQSVTHNE